MIDYKVIPGGITAVEGFSAAGVQVNIKKAKKDMAMVYCHTPARAAAVYTQNKVKAAPIVVNAQNLSQGEAQAIVVNSGVANACTGEQGLADAREMVSLTAELLGLESHQIIVASTGVIGVNLPMDKVRQGIKECSRKLSPDGGLDAAAAIMTTDTYPKEYAVEFELDGKKVVIGGMSKGSGMIHPNMATMLGFLSTNISISKEMLKATLSHVVDETFNMITVDGDTSTNDMVAVLASGSAGNAEITTMDKNYHAFTKVLKEVAAHLAKEVVRDGEGATKLLSITVDHAYTVKDARRAAMAVANSSLVKTAFFGEDANWGRIFSAVGYSGAEFSPGKVDIWIESEAGSEQMLSAGAGLKFDEVKTGEILARRDINVKIDLKVGDKSATAWTCDFSYDYVKINADYRT
ncbi:bifunctional glutamate N-acetyltransferase/amino-acid acetyltransferase ArgJ [Metallumcola ferriviriculae]|uniref:Arginine biosynthesis bifunctional protein ArgJ n=1 Tax=Metallumcola ferriviriculae TaxID=3039180 RepID=A0AAU0UHD4_9FIRM|nr:bifunctional glutamate N-acetyltransferase/amino-acid acetyltransferase ArgJ [Desulfitibacteraceae bacterium MK1]